MSERTVMRLLRKNYPTIFDELTQEAALYDLSQIEPLLDKFCLAKGIEKGDVYRNKCQSRMLFIAIVSKAYDPMFFVDEDKALVRGLREKLASTLFCHETQISHSLASVRTYIKFYKNFRDEVQYLYGLMVNHIIDESKN